MKGPLLLVVLDGWGHRVEAESNAILACAPYFHELLGRHPHTLLDACGKEVGLPLGIMGNSEVGHMNLGAGQVIYQDITRIDKAIEEGDFFENGALTGLVRRVMRDGKRLHVMGLVSDAGVHSSDHHLRSVVELTKRQGLDGDKLLIHAITDGRDTPPRSGAAFLGSLHAELERTGMGRIASVVGRYWAMDRDNRWDRAQRAYDLFVSGRGETAESAVAALEASYAKDVGDEFLEPTVIGKPDEGRFEDGDGLIFFNFRSDRARQICMALTFDDFDGFERSRRAKVEMVTFTRYRADFPYAIAFPPTELHGIFPELVSAAGLRQKRIAETEKYAHVTFFFSGGEEDPYPGEGRILVPSPRVATYDLQPEMSAREVTDAILAELQKGETEVYVINYANADMVGHTGIYDAAMKAVATIDACLQRLVPAVEQCGGVVAITADHGNSEQLWDPLSNQPHTAHTLNPVPFVLCGADVAGARLRPRGILADVAPTLLELLGLEPSPPMNGATLLIR